MVASHGRITWSHHMVASHGGITWWHHMVASHGGITWWHHMVATKSNSFFFPAPANGFDAIVQ